MTDTSSLLAWDGGRSHHSHQPAVISAGTLGFHSIEAPGDYTRAFPTLPHAQWKHVASHTRKLRELAERVRALERALRGQLRRGDAN
jgi:hypothetical protein